MEIPDNDPILCGNLVFDPLFCVHTLPHNFWNLNPHSTPNSARACYSALCPSRYPGPWWLILEEIFLQRIPFKLAMLTMVSFKILGMTLVKDGLLNYWESMGWKSMQRFADPSVSKPNMDIPPWWSIYKSWSKHVNTSETRLSWSN